MEIKKAQIMSIDLLISALIFSIILAILVVKFTDYGEEVSDKAEYREMMLRAFEISDALIKTRGVPTGWNSTNVLFLGLASEDRKISKEKAEEFCKIPEGRVRSMLEINYYFYFNLNGTITCGRAPSSGSRVVSLKRNIFYRGKNAILEFTLWK